MVAGQLPFQTMVSAMRRERQKLAERIPESLLGYGDMLQTNERFRKTISGQEFFKGSLLDGDDVSLVFVSPYLASQLRDSRVLMIDATFRAVPLYPRSKQLLTIMAIGFDHVSIRC